MLELQETLVGERNVRDDLLIKKTEFGAGGALRCGRGLLPAATFALQDLLGLSLLCFFQILYMILLNISLRFAYGKDEFSGKGASMW